MDDRRNGDSNLVQIEATVMRQTLGSLLRSVEETGLSIGEVIDRLALHMKPTRPEFALQLILEEIRIILSDLPGEQKDATLCEVLIFLAALLPTDAIERIQDAAKEKKKQMFGDVGKEMLNST